MLSQLNAKCAMPDMYFLNLFLFFWVSHSRCLLPLLHQFGSWWANWAEPCEQLCAHWNARFSIFDYEATWEEISFYFLRCINGIFSRLFFFFKWCFIFCRITNQILESPWSAVSIYQKCFRCVIVLVKRMNMALNSRWMLSKVIIGNLKE